MLAKRVIACLDVKDGRVVKGINFLQLRDAGDPAELASAYNREGVDEVVFLDITASTEKRGLIVETVARTARQVFIPLTVGGGIRTERASLSPADKARRIRRAASALMKGVEAKELMQSGRYTKAEIEAAKAMLAEKSK